MPKCKDILRSQPRWGRQETLTIDIFPARNNEFKRQIVCISTPWSIKNSQLQMTTWYKHLFYDIYDASFINDVLFCQNLPCPKTLALGLLRVGGLLDLPLKALAKWVRAYVMYSKSLIVSIAVLYCFLTRTCTIYSRFVYHLPLIFFIYVIIKVEKTLSGKAKKHWDCLECLNSEEYAAVNIIILKSGYNHVENNPINLTFSPVIIGTWNLEDIFLLNSL